MAKVGFDIGWSVTLKLSEGDILLMADGNEVQVLREHIYQTKKVVKGIKDVLI